MSRFEGGIPASEGKKPPSEGGMSASSVIILPSGGKMPPSEGGMPLPRMHWGRQVLILHHLFTRYWRPLEPIVPPPVPSLYPVQLYPPRNIFCVRACLACFVSLLFRGATPLEYVAAPVPCYLWAGGCIMLEAYLPCLDYMFLSAPDAAVSKCQHVYTKANLAYYHLRTAYRSATNAGSVASRMR